MKNNNNNKEKKKQISQRAREIGSLRPSIYKQRHIFIWGGLSTPKTQQSGRWEDEGFELRRRWFRMVWYGTG